MKKSNSVADYEFKVVGVDDFELTIIFKPEGTILALLMKQAHKALKQKTGVMPQSHQLEELLDKHILPSQYNRLVHGFVRPVLKQVYNEVVKDGVKVLRENPERVLFYKKKDQWFVEIQFKGTHHKN
jgi:hypothetical protein